jgi:hypothetical protein
LITSTLLTLVLLQVIYEWTAIEGVASLIQLAVFGLLIGLIYDKTHRRI